MAGEYLPRAGRMFDLSNFEQSPARYQAYIVSRNEFAKKDIKENALAK